VVSVNDTPVNVVLALAASVEQRSEHPIAQAIVKYAESSSIQVHAASNVAALSGRGAEGRVGAAQVVLGNHRLFEERHLCSADVHAGLDELNAQGQTPVLVARDGLAVGIIAVADTLRETGRDTVD